MDSKIKAHFKKVDPYLFKLLIKVGESGIHISTKPSKKYFSALCSNIISQQLSGRVSEVFWSRFIKLFHNGVVSPQKLLDLPDKKLRSIGISNSKVAYLKSLADHFVNKKIRISDLSRMPEEEVITELTQVRGIGRWTAEMFLMFTLGRPDVFSPGDQGLKNAITGYYKKPPDPAIWSPYRTYACLILWKSLEK